MPADPPCLELAFDGPVVTVAPFTLADGSDLARQQTVVLARADATALCLQFGCADDDPWATLRGRDEPLWSEECVEVFISPGADDPVRYFEFEVNPLGALFDARIHNPTGQRADMTADVAWDCPGVEWRATIHPDKRHWAAWLTVPWASLLEANTPLPREWRVNFHRIDRPSDGRAPEFSSWASTLTTPPNFHVPARFGRLRLT